MSAPLNLSAVQQVTDDALIAEVNRRLREGHIEVAALEFPKDDDEGTGGGHGL